MARANRHFIPNCIWHITHRCHKREFLLKFRKDKKNWVNWLFEVKKRYGLSILNYAVTSNHIHLIVVDTDGHHLLRCLIYIDMNMVRAGVVKHPSGWDYCGYHEILNPPQRYTLIDYDKLLLLCGYTDKEQFQSEYDSWINDEIKNDNLKRESYWTESIAVGDEHFINDTKKELSIKAIGRKIRSEDDNYVIREKPKSYNAVFDTEKCNLRPNNLYFWDVLS